MRLFHLSPYITCLSYGPYDNGYILLGFNDGTLLSLDFLSFSIFDKKQAFEYVAITSVNFEPTRFIFVGSEQGDMVALSFAYQKTHYMYLELGMKRYCTIKVPKKGTSGGARNRMEDDPTTQVCCY